MNNSAQNALAQGLSSLGQAVGLGQAPAGPIVSQQAVNPIWANLQSNVYSSSYMPNLSTIMRSSVSGITATGGGFGRVAIYGDEEDELEKQEKTLKETQGEMLKRFMKLNQ